MAGEGKEDGGFFSSFTCFGEKKKDRGGGQEGRWDTVERAFFCDCGRDVVRGNGPVPMRGVPRLAQRNENVAGVGIVFHENVERDDGLVVEDIVVNGPAHKTGMVEKGMRLISIDGRNVVNMRSEEIAPLILGEANSEVALGFQKANGEASSVKIVREFQPVQR